MPRIKVGRAGNGVESWMKQIETSMQTIVHKKIKEAHTNYYTEKVQRKDWVLNHIGQAIAAIAQVVWTCDCEQAINEMDY